MNNILKLKTVNKLKSVYRLNSVKGRHESSAEHSWSSLILADYFLEFHKELDHQKVYDLLIYHDLVEIETGDIPLQPGPDKRDNSKDEFEAAKKLRKELPKILGNKFYTTFIEFQEQKTKEARFARAIDVFDSMVQEIDFKTDWKGWSKEFLIKKKAKYFEEFPVIKGEFYKALEYLETQGYFSQ